MSEYLRLRLKKIEKFILTLDPDVPGLLSKEEQTFARSLKGITEAHFHSLALKSLPAAFAKIPANKKQPRLPLRKIDPRLPEPNPDSFVFVKAEKDLRGVLLEDPTLQGNDEEVDMDQGSQHLMLYSSAESLIKNGSLRLF